MKVASVVVAAAAFVIFTAVILLMSYSVLIAMPEQITFFMQAPVAAACSMSAEMLATPMPWPLSGQHRSGSLCLPVSPFPSSCIQRHVRAS